MFFFRTNLTSMSMITEIISAIPQPSTLTATTPVVPDYLQLVDPCKLDLKEIICLYFSDGTCNCIMCLFCSFSKEKTKKNLIWDKAKTKKLFLPESHLHSLPDHCRILVDLSGQYYIMPYLTIFLKLVRS